MASAKEIIVKVIPAKIANDFVKKLHYSGKVVNNSTLHFGCFLNGRLHGAMQFGCPLDKRKVIGLVVDKDYIRRGHILDAAELLDDDGTVVDAAGLSELFERNQLFGHVAIHTYQKLCGRLVVFPFDGFRTRKDETGLDDILRRLRVCPAVHQDGKHSKQACQNTATKLTVPCVRCLFMTFVQHCSMSVLYCL